MHTVTIESIVSCTSKEYSDLYHDPGLSTDDLVKDAISMIKQHEERLRAENNTCRLDNLLFGMLSHAPHPGGKRYAAVAIHTASTEGEDAVVNLAKAWLDNLFLPMLVISIPDKTVPSGGQTPKSNETVHVIEPATQTVDFRTQLAIREQHCCAVTRSFDVARVFQLMKEGKCDEIPAVSQSDIEAAHILPFLLNNFPEGDNISPLITDAACTWDMFKAWTGINLATLSRSLINSPENGIFMKSAEHTNFGRYRLYFDKDAFPDSPNKYQARMVHPLMRFSNGASSVDVLFPTVAQSGIEPPNAELLKIHASFAKVFYLCNAATYFDSLERDDFALLLRLKLGTLVK